jgi:hypothetical protein
MTEDEKLAQLDFTDPQQVREALEHAKAAATGSREGIRLWMLDCGELVAKHRARADAAEQPRTDSRAEDPIGELRWELGARTRQYDRVCRDMKALTEEVISALSTDQHRMIMWGGLPFCQCKLSLAGGDASGAFITHILAVWRETGR